MDTDKVWERLEQHSGESATEGLTTLAEDLVIEARKPANHTINRYLYSTNPEDREKAMNMLAELRELALVPLAHCGNAPDLNTELWIMRTLADELDSFRLRTALFLRELLMNELPAVFKPEPHESWPVDTRICDVAFVLLCQLLHHRQRVEAFLNESPASRNNSIGEFRSSSMYRRTFERKS